ncbi:MAG: hypothetical protein H7235_06900 [Bdellovibrionaceae bacterium]|nr:hypothetical protein [Pseudobdellovibrionaceae bacterium]
MKLTCLLTLSLSLSLGVSCSKVYTGGNHLKNYQQFSISQDIPTTPTCDEQCVLYRKEFRYVVYAGKQIYCYWDEKKTDTGTDFDQLATKLESQITTKYSLQNYYLLLMTWAAAFHDGHVNAMIGKVSPASFEFYEPNIRFELLNAGTDSEKLIVAKIGDDVKNLKVGTLVTSINGKPWTEIYEKAVSLSSGSTVRMRRKQAARHNLALLLGQTDGFKLHIEGEFDDQPVAEDIARELLLDDGQIAPPVEKTGIELIHAKVLEGNIGYLRIDGFQGTKIRELLDQAMQRLFKTERLLIDVRANGGGDLSGDSVLSYLIEQPIFRYAAEVRNSDLLLGLRPALNFVFNFQSADWSVPHNYLVQPKMKFQGPVAVLTSTICFSACDTFLTALQENHLAHVIGESTGGGTGTPLVLDLPVSNLQFRYSVQKGFKPVSHKLLEGQGTEVDQLIAPTVDEKQKSLDTQLALALNYVRNLPTATSASSAPASLTKLTEIIPAEPEKIQKSPLSELNDAIQISGAETN